MRTPICDQLGIDIPLFAFSHCRDVVAAVTKAGGFGVLGALAYSPEQLDVELSWIDEEVQGRPYGVDIVIPQKMVGKGGGVDTAALAAMVPDAHRAFVRELLDERGVPPLPDGTVPVVKAAGLGAERDGPGQVEVALRHPVRMIVNALGVPPVEVIDTVHRHGILVGALAGSVRHARKQVDMGVDVVIAQGTEAGGHCGEIATMVLVPDVVDAVGDRAVVLAAGGIGTGRQLAAALALGAQGGWTGSLWLTVAEADTSPPAVENLLAAGAADAIRSRAMTGKPARQLRTAWTEAWETPAAPDPLPMPLQGILYSEAAARFTRSRSRDFAGSPAGQVIGRLDRVRSTREVIDELVREFVATTERLAGLLAP